MRSDKAGPLSLISKEPTSGPTAQRRGFGHQLDLRKHLGKVVFAVYLRSRSTADRARRDHHPSPGGRLRSPHTRSTSGTCGRTVPCCADSALRPPRSHADPLYLRARRTRRTEPRYAENAKVLTSRNSSNPKWPPSRPIPDDLYPPNGAASGIGTPFRRTIPAFNRLPTRSAFGASAHCT